MPKLTVLMPVYNASRFLRQAIESILNQTFIDFEFIIIDDGSIDDSVAIIRSYPDSRIRFYQNEKNVGISATLNRGIQLADSEWIARMDSDDISYPDRLQRQYDFILQNPDGALFSCGVQVIDEEEQLIRRDSFKSEFYYYNLTLICWIYHPTVIYSKNAVEAVGMYTAAYSEDFELFWQLTRKFKMYNLTDILLDYRVTSQSLHQVLKKQEYAEAQQQQILRNIRSYVGEGFTTSPEIIDCFQHNFEPLLNQNKTGEIVRCLSQLKIISQGILSKENVNRDYRAIKRAAVYKRRFIIAYFIRTLPWPKAIILLWGIKEYRMLKNHLWRTLIKKQATT